MDDFATDHTYDFERQGSFGTFRTEWSFPLEYFMVSFKPDEIKNLTLAKRLKPSKKLNFDMLLQRDIDERRIAEELEPYLRGLQAKQQLDAAEGAIFFPPIIAAVVPVTSNEIDDFYETESEGQGNNASHLVREWHGHFRTTHILNQGVDAVTAAVCKKDEKPDYRKVKRDPVKFEARLAGDEGSGVRLVVIDGQHRLVTLSNILTTKPEILKNMSFAVCIVYAPMCTATVANQAASEGHAIPKIHEVFRKLFLDVNRTAERVSGHFEHLLNDVDTSAIASRQFCKHVLEHQGKEGLAQIEWNVRNNKESKTVTRNYSLTSIGVITPELDAHFTRHFEKLLRIAEVKDQLFDDDDEPKRVNYQRLTLRQKPVIEEQVRKHLVPLLNAVFFEADAYKKLRDAFLANLQAIRVDMKSQGKPGAAAEAAEAYLLEYADYHGDKGVRGRLLEFEEKYLASLGFAIESTDRPLVTRTIFQKAVFEAINELISLVKNLDPNTDNLARAVKTWLNIALAKDGFAFSSDRTYLQYLVYTQKRLNQGVESRRALAWLMMGCFKSPGASEALVSALGVSGPSADATVKALQDVGLASLKKLLSTFSARRLSAFESGFANDLSIPLKERNQFQDALRQKEVDIERAQNGEIDATKISKAFDSMVAERIQPDLIEGREQLKKALNLTVELVTESTGSDVLDFDE